MQKESLELEDSRNDAQKGIHAPEKARGVTPAKSPSQNPKVLIVRFSSFGDIFHCLGPVRELRAYWPQSEIHWVTRNDFYDLLKAAPALDRVWSLNRKDGFLGLFRLSRELQAQKFTHIYDAHNNLRSHLLCFLVRAPHFVRRSKERFRRFLLFWLRRNQFETPYRSQISFLRPLREWGLLPQKRLDGRMGTLVFSEKDRKPLGQFHLKSKNFVVLVPSAAWELKRWPKDYWSQLIASLQNETLVLLGGPEDQFIHEIKKQSSHPNLVDLSGKLTLLESSYLVSESKLTISGDTGFLHLADLLGVPLIALIGPTAFGYPSSSTSITEEVRLNCKPCSKDGRGRCTNPTYKRCLYDLKPERVLQSARHILGAGAPTEELTP